MSPAPAVPAVPAPAYGVVVAGARESLSPSAGAVDFGDGVALPGAGLVDGWVTRIGEDGSVLWARLFSGPAGTGEIMPRAVGVMCDASVVLAGSATDGALFGEGPLTGAGKHDVFVHRMDDAGNALWSKLLGGPEDDAAASVWIDGRVIHVGGSFAGNATFGALAFESAGAEDAFVMEVAP